MRDGGKFVSSLFSACVLPVPIPDGSPGSYQTSIFFAKIDRQMGNRLYVGNLSWDTNEDSLRTAFSQDDRDVKDVQILTDRDTGRSRGFGFVEMGSDEDAQAAITALDGADVDGRNIKVNEARERQPRTGGGDGGGGGGGYGGGGGGGGGRW
jgi:RNA recognition motif-containing protein